MNLLCPGVGLNIKTLEEIKREKAIQSLLSTNGRCLSIARPHLFLTVIHTSCGVEK